MIQREKTLTQCEDWPNVPSGHYDTDRPRGCRMNNGQRFFKKVRFGSFSFILGDITDHSGAGLLCIDSLVLIDIRLDRGICAVGPRGLRAEESSLCQVITLDTTVSNYFEILY